MEHSFQIVWDCTLPHELAQWWAKTLGRDVEPQDAEFIASMISKGFAREDETMQFNGALVWKSGAALSATATSPRLLFQEVPESKKVKNRLHLDVYVEEGTLDQAKDELLERGATFMHRGSQGPHHWYTFQDPEGNEFCVAER